MSTESPQVGMGATMVIGSDRYPYEIVRLSDSGKTFWMKHLSTKPGEDHNYFGNQNWIIYKPDNFDNLPEVRVSLLKNGRWASYGTPVSVGHASFYQDPHF